jgi:hypothetical protein
MYILRETSCITCITVIDKKDVNESPQVALYPVLL